MLFFGRIRAIYRTDTEKEQDVILNNIDSVCFEKMRVEWPSIAMVYRKIVNDVLGRMDLKYDSMLSMPYAITKKQLKTLDMISCRTLFCTKSLLLRKGGDYNPRQPSLTPP